MSRFSLFSALVSALVMVNIHASSPLSLKGTYRFNGEINKMQAKRVIPVYAFSASGRRLLEELKDEGYQCKLLPRQTYRCQIFDSSLTPSPSVMRRAQRDFESFELYISDRVVSPQIISEGESVVVYRYNKTIAVNEIEYPYYDYQISQGQNGDIHKIKFGSGLNRREFLVSHESLLKKVLLLGDQERTYFDQFLLSGSFSNL